MVTIQKLQDVCKLMHRIETGLALAQGLLANVKIPTTQRLLAEHARIILTVEYETLPQLLMSKNKGALTATSKNVLEVLRSLQQLAPNRGTVQLYRKQYTARKKQVQKNLKQIPPNTRNALKLNTRALH